ncbi:uncharacterized, partial [Tachysurus ichikawai]
KAGGISASDLISDLMCSPQDSSKFSIYLLSSDIYYRTPTLHRDLHQNTSEEHTSV